MEEFRDRTAVITGGASGIGLALARRLGREGANVVLADVEADALERSAADLAGDGVAVLAMPTDVTDRSALAALADAAEERFGPVHFLHNNAGVAIAGPAEELSDAQWDWLLDVNLRAVIWGCREFLPRMKAHGEPAHILNTASMAGMSGGPLMAPYFTTKFAVVGLSESLWHEAQLAGSNVGVSVLCPGFVRTGIARSHRNEPPGTGGWIAAGSTSGSHFAELLTAGVESGIEPDEVAEIALTGVRAGRLWILTHPESNDTIQARAAAITGDGVPPASRFARE
jgi:NAD(P)-dependent dehydrogenase (short-subunit alcohol dehydrogenase family)